MRLDLFSDRFEICRSVFKRSLALVYVAAFAAAWGQLVPLIGQNGLLPAGIFVAKAPLADFPSLFFWLKPSDFALKCLSGLGLALSAGLALGWEDRTPRWLAAGGWLALWALYLSIVNIGQTFYGFGWESILLEAGFLAAFLGNSKTPSPEPVFLWVRWLLFRIMFGAGLIKLKGDACWLDLTCLHYHYETQPIPNPLSWYWHHLPGGFHRGEVLATHFVELVVPWGLFGWGRVRRWAGGLTLAFQICLILSGNLSFLNYLTIVLCLACLDDTFWKKLKPARDSETHTTKKSKWIASRQARSFVATLLRMTPKCHSEARAGNLSCHSEARAGNLSCHSEARAGGPKNLSPKNSAFRPTLLWILSVALSVLSIQPALNLLSNRQIMNTSYNPFHLVGTYGAFGSVGKVRREVVLEGAAAEDKNGRWIWKEYELPCKPGDPYRHPCVSAPYHRRLDWQMWFAAMSPYPHHPWILNLCAKLLKNDPEILKLFAGNPFEDKPPRLVRAALYEYRFATPDERRSTGAWWIRSRLGTYLPPLSLRNPEFISILRRLGWDRVIE